MARVELDQLRAVRACRPDLPARVDRGISQGRDDDVTASERRGHRVERRLVAQVLERPVGLRA